MASPSISPPARAIDGEQRPTLAIRIAGWQHDIDAGVGAQWSGLDAGDDAAGVGVLLARSIVIYISQST